MNTLATCVCVCLYVCLCVFVLAYCGLPWNIISKFTNFLYIYMCVVACIPATFRTNIQKDEQNESICLALFCYPAATFVCCDACDIRCSFPAKLHQCVVVASVVAIFA